MDTDVTQPKKMPCWGLDRRMENRPGVPRDAAPHPLEGAHWTEPEQQVATTPVLLRVGLERPTPVFGTAQPPRGLSGALRRMAYRVPDWRARHWMILIFADRIDAIEGRLARVGRLWPIAAIGAATAAVMGIRSARRRR